MPNLSIIIPVYNVEAYLPRCLDSVCNQTLSNLQIICVDDGSTDNGGRILAEYARRDKRIQIISQKNSGLSIARNVGLNYAKGKYVTFLDSDDWVAPDFYEKLYNAAVENSADISAGNVLYWRDDTQIYSSHVSWWTLCSAHSVITDISDKWHILQSCACWNKIYKTDLIKRNGVTFYLHRTVEDFPYTFLICGLAQKIVLCPDAFLFYRQRSTSIMADPSKTVRNCFDVIANWNNLFHDIDTMNLPDKARLYRIAQTFAMDNCLAWSERLRKKSDVQRYFGAFAALVKNFFVFDMDTEPFYASVIFGLKHRWLNHLFTIRYKSQSIEYRIGRTTLFRIKRCHNAVRYMLFGRIKLYKKIE